MRRLAGAVLFALATSACEEIPVDSKKYNGILPGYGITEMTVYTYKGSNEIVSVEFRTEKDGNKTEMNDRKKDGRLEFTDGRIMGDEYFYQGNFYPGWANFKPAEDMARYLLTLRGIRLEEVKKPQN